MNMPLTGNNTFAGIIKLNSHWIGMGPNPMTGIRRCKYGHRSTKREMHVKTQRHRETQGKDHMRIETESVVTCLEAMHS